MRRGVSATVTGRSSVPPVPPGMSHGLLIFYACLAGAASCVSKAQRPAFAFPARAAPSLPWGSHLMKASMAKAFDAAHDGVVGELKVLVKLLESEDMVNEDCLETLAVRPLERQFCTDFSHDLFCFTACPRRP